ncbi:MAG: phosphopyruvate hydratase [Patescibacteria group bacterium]|nr:phosphopyruvate hydratase [Patescibacteria group bacterium]
MKILDYNIKKILDSRSNWTIELELYNEKNIGVKSSVPSGKSTGKNEVFNLDPDQAILKAKYIFSKIKNKDFKSQQEFDHFLISLDKTVNKSYLGGNTILAFSYCFAKLNAYFKHIELYDYFNNLVNLKNLKIKPKMPYLFVNVINGGLHAGNNLKFQEYLIIPKTNDILKAINLARILYLELGKELKKIKGNNATNIGDEGGYAPNFKNDFEPFEIISKILKKLNLDKEFYFGLDAAANSINLSNDKLEKFYLKLIKKINLIYLEDPFAEEDFEQFKKLKLKLKNVYICGDDLTTTNMNSFKKADSENSINSVIIKPNQIGTISETIEAIQFAKQKNWWIIVSHRSGETNDDLIADLAYGVAANGFKLGAPARGERVAKYNRLLEIANQ